MLRRYEGTELWKHWVGVIYEVRGTDVVQDQRNECRGTKGDSTLDTNGVLPSSEFGGAEVRRCGGVPEDRS